MNTSRNYENSAIQRSKLISQQPQSTSGGLDASHWSLKIAVEPPDKSVYKRNLSPCPVVVVNGPEIDDNVSLQVQVLLIRCDTQEVQPDGIRGSLSYDVAESRTIEFTRIKAFTTSYLHEDNFFSLRFELVCFQDPDDEEEEGEVLASATSIPIFLLSHSTQLKSAKTSKLPQISEIIPNTGQCQGGTRVCIIGKNFVDSPSMRVRFGNQEVVPSFFGEGTLVCHTPPCSDQSKLDIVVRVGTNGKYSATMVQFKFVGLDPVVPLKLSGGLETFKPVDAEPFKRSFSSIRKSVEERIKIEIPRKFGEADVPKTTMIYSEVMSAVAEPMSDFDFEWPTTGDWFGMDVDHIIIPETPLSKYDFGEPEKSAKKCRISPGLTSSSSSLSTSTYALAC